MKNKFTCKKCGKTGEAACSRELPFLHCSWYKDYKGLIHGCLYCRNCGAIYDTIGSLVAPIKILLGRMPSKIVASYDFSEFEEIIKRNDSDIPSLQSMNPYIINAIIEDGRLSESELEK